MNEERNEATKKNTRNINKPTKNYCPNANITTRLWNFVCIKFVDLSQIYLWLNNTEENPSQPKWSVLIHSFILCTKTATQLYIQLAISRSMYHWKWSNSAYGTYLTHELLNLDIWIWNPIHWNWHTWLPSKTYECQ